MVKNQSVFYTVEENLYTLEENYHICTEEIFK